MRAEPSEPDARRRAAPRTAPDDAEAEPGRRRGDTVRRTTADRDFAGSGVERGTGDRERRRSARGGESAGERAAGSPLSRRRADTDDDPARRADRDAGPATGRRRDAADAAPRRSVGTSGTGRSVVGAGTARVPARSAERDRTAATARTGARRSKPDRTRTAAAAEPVPETAPRRARARAADDGDPGHRTVRERSARTRASSDAGTVRTAAAPGRTRQGDDVEGETRRTRRRSDGSGDSGERLRADRIDETLTRLTAAHAGLSLADFPHADDDPDAAEDDADDTPVRPAASLAVRAGRLGVAAVALVLVLVSGLGWVGRTRLDGALHQVAAVDVAPDGVLDAAAQTGDQNVLLLATDSGSSDHATTRANTVVVLHTDATGERPVAVTLPSDLEITRPPCERWDATAGAYSGQTVPAEPRTTFASAYATGGPRCATRAAQQVTGLAITRFVAVDLAATSALVESVGGVDACVERPVLDAVLGPVVPTAGTSTLNGARAGDLVRAADVRDDPAPAEGLVARQQRVLAAVLGRALSLERLLHPGRVGRVLPALDTAVVSTGTGVDDLLALSRTLARSDGVTMRTAPAEPAANSRGNRVLHDAEAAALFAAVRTERPLPPAAATTPTTAATPADVTSDILNASGRDGLAAQVAGTLGDLGFHTAEVTNAPQPALDTVVRFSPDRAEQAQLLAAAVPSASSVPDPGTSGVLQLVLGRSFDGTVRAAAAPTPGPAAPSATAPAASCD